MSVLPPVVQRVPRPDHLARACKLLHVLEHHPDVWPPIIKLSSRRHIRLVDGWVATAAVKQLEEKLGSALPTDGQYGNALNNQIFFQIRKPPVGYLYIGSIPHAIAQLRARLPPNQAEDVCSGQHCPLLAFQPVLKGPSQTVREVAAKGDERVRVLQERVHSLQEKVAEQSAKLNKRARAVRRLKEQKRTLTETNEGLVWEVIALKVTKEKLLADLKALKQAARGSRELKNLGVGPTTSTPDENACKRRRR
ncbi:hypothetical protein WJX72_005051 [[Myrmecia] bisecta]|uniref:Uncharacterized protein n=1 Tax=[Myrmecia] bisecta TaxID=41462 RepID=A0AAW1PSQ9_9CHLO